jgi:hypothetical protein
MGWLSDNFDFEKFHLSDMWDRIKDDPKRLLLGVDPASTEIWNGILGRDDEPIVNFLGGPMGSGWTGMGTGGVYDRAEAEGINTKAAMGMHDVAETVAGIWGGYGAAQGMGGAFGGGGEGGSSLMPGEWDWMKGGEGGFDWQNMMGQMGGMGGGQQQQGAPPPRGIPRTQSSFDPSYPQPMTPYMPGRSTPFGLLMEDDNEQRMKAMLGGLL